VPLQDVPEGHRRDRCGVRAGQARGADLAFRAGLVRQLAGGAAAVLLGVRFDDPSRFRPVAHAGCESIHEAWLDTKDLPRLFTASTASVVKHWQAAGLDVPE
jgi:hypothetical protein